MHTANLEQENCTALCKLDLFREGMNHHPHVPLLSCTQQLRLGCEILDDEMNYVQKIPMQNHMFIFELEYEATTTSLERL